LSFYSLDFQACFLEHLREIGFGFWVEGFSAFLFFCGLEMNEHEEEPPVFEIALVCPKRAGKEGDESLCDVL